MTQASVNITQQFKDGGVVPATLTGQNAVSKTYVDAQLAIRDANISAAAGAASAAQADIDAHEASTTAHPAQNITYTGLVAGAANVKQGLDNLYTRVNDIIADGDSSAEVVDARGGYPVLGDRLNATDAQLAETVTGVFNVKSGFGAIGNGVSDDTTAIQEAVNRAAQSGGGLVYFPPGVYLITSTIVIPSSVIIFEGLGEVSVLTGAVDLIQANETNTVFSLRKMKINPRDNADGFVTINSAMTGRTIFVDETTFESSGSDGGSGSGVLFKAQTIHGVRVVNSRFVRGRIGIDCVGVVNFTVSGTYFSGQKSGGISNQEWAMKFTETNYPLEGIRISNCNIVDWKGGIYASDALDLSIQNCMIDQNDTLLVMDSCGPARIFDNYFGARITSDPCIKIKSTLKKSSYLKVHGNTFSCNNMASYGIDICPDANDDNCEYSSFNDNTIIGWTVYGLRYNPSKMIFSTITANMFPGGANKITPALGAGTGNYISDNQGGNGGLGSIYTTASSKQRCYVNTVLKSLTGGTTTEDVDFDISSAGFVGKATVGFISCASNQSIVGYYMYDSSSTTATNARFRLKMDNATNLIAGTQRFSLLLFQ